MLSSAQKEVARASVQKSREKKMNEIRSIMKEESERGNMVVWSEDVRSLVSVCKLIDQHAMEDGSFKYKVRNHRHALIKNERCVY